MRALKYHGGVEVDDLAQREPAALEKGVANLERHVNNVRNHYGLPCVVAINHFDADTDAEIDAAHAARSRTTSAPVVVARHWADGGAGAEELARDGGRRPSTRVPGDFRFVYDDADTLWDKVNKVAKTIYGASDVTADSKVRAQIRELQDEGYGHYPGVHRQDAVLVLDRSAAARRAVSGHVDQHPRGAARRRRGVRRA